MKTKAMQTRITTTDNNLQLLVNKAFNEMISGQAGDIKCKYGELLTTPYEVLHLIEVDEIEGINSNAAKVVGSQTMLRHI